MANMAQTLGKRISVRTALFISVAFILLRWLTKTITNIYYVYTALNRVGSMQGLSLSALTNGIFTVLSVTLLLVLSRETYRDLGFHRRHLLKQLGRGFLFGVGIFILDTFVVGPVVDALLPKMSAEGIDMGILFNNIAYLPIWIVMAVLKGGFSEELWRTFTLTRFEKCFGKSGLVFALIASSIVFGLGHLYQGVGGMIANSIEGLFYALVYLRKGSAWEAVFAHAVFDLIAVALGFMIYSG